MSDYPKGTRCAGWLMLGLAISCSRNNPRPAANEGRLVAPAASAAPRLEPAVEVPGDQRFEPPGLAPGERRPLLLFLHGLGSSGRIAFQGLGLQELAARERFHLIAPNGSTDSRGRRFWNAHPACCDFDGRGIDDVRRLAGLLDSLAAEPHVDPRRLYVVGFSNGGFMAHRLACEHGTRIAAIASIAGVGPGQGVACKASQIAVLEVHGDADQVVRYDGGHLFGRRELPSHSSALETLGDWAKHLSCRSGPRAGPKLDLDQQLPGEETDTLTLNECPGGSAALWTVRGGGHAIGADPGFQQRIWHHLSKYTKPG